MDEKLKTQAFRFTNQFKPDEPEDEESLEESVTKTPMPADIRDESEEESIEEEIGDSHGFLPKKVEPKVNYPDSDSVEMLKNLNRRKPPAVPSKSPNSS